MLHIQLIVNLPALTSSKYAGQAGIKGVGPLSSLWSCARAWSGCLWTIGCWGRGADGRGQSGGCWLCVSTTTKPMRSPNWSGSISACDSATCPDTNICATSAAAAPVLSTVNSWLVGRLGQWWGGWGPRMAAASKALRWDCRRWRVTLG
jgi:hypothetical protein